MTFEQILLRAQRIAQAKACSCGCVADAAWLVDTFSEAQPCGFEPPVVDPGMVSIMDNSNDPDPAYQFTPAEARWYAGALLRAADEAERKPDA